MKRKIRIGIDINEILRARWVQFDKYYTEEFGEDGLPNKENQYVYDFYNEYKWEDTIETFRELREPEDIPEDINPLDYRVDEKSGKAPADFLLFKKEEKIHLTKREMYNRFMYEDYLFEIHGSAPMVYRGVDLDLNKFYDRYKDNVEITLFSVENGLSIAPTQFFVSKLMTRIGNMKLIENECDIFNSVDIIITTNPFFFEKKAPKDKKIIKIIRPYNAEKQHKHYYLSDNELINLTSNKKFNKLIHK